MRNRRVCWLLVGSFGLWGLMGCGSAQPTGGSTGEEEEAEHHEGGEHGEEGEHHEHDNLTPGLAAFHEAIRPVWHSEPGAARGALACQNVLAFRERAAAIAAELAPAGADSAAWQSGGGALTQAVAGLATECGTPAHTNADARLAEVHDAFHAMTALMPGDDDDHGEHHGDDHGDDDDDGDDDHDD